LGSAIAEVIVAEAPIPMKILGVPGIFAPTGSAEFLLDEFGMSPAGIGDAAKTLIARKSSRI
ncbi:MAG TPA: transketolase family protein, partial [Rhizobium sp.]|nr:transketolase family protein [Rhizobium sp.]